MRCEEKEKKSKTGVPYGFPEMGNICKKQIVSRGKVTNRARAGRGRRAGVSVRRPAGACLHRLMMSPSRGSPTCTGVCWDCDQCGIRAVVKIYMKMHKSSHKCSNVNRETVLHYAHDAQLWKTELFSLDFFQNSLIWKKNGVFKTRRIRLCQLYQWNLLNIRVKIFESKKMCFSCWMKFYESGPYLCWTMVQQPKATQRQVVPKGHHKVKSERDFCFRVTYFVAEVVRWCDFRVIFKQHFLERHLTVMSCQWQCGGSSVT